jgi:hypothetical protein
VEVRILLRHKSLGVKVKELVAKKNAHGKQAASEPPTKGDI